MVTVRDANPGGTLSRSNCIRIAAGPGAEGECGDLVYVHGLPATRVLNRTFAPSLVYNSATAFPHPVVRANVTVPSTSGAPNSVTAVLSVDGSVVASASWAGSAFTPGQAKRIALGYDAGNASQGLHPSRLEVTSIYTGVSLSTAVVDTLAIVNRIYSPFGSGWWLNGLESITSYGSVMLWIGGDGSTRVYRPTGTDWGPWTAEYSNGVDSLVYVPTPTDGSAAYYARKLRGGGEVRYAASTGQQVATVNRLGFVTTFTWESNAYNGFGVRLTSITLPVRSDFNTGLAYNFGYAAANVPLSTVVAPALPGQPRVVQLRSGTGWDVTAVTDPDGARDSLSYDGSMPHRVSGIRDARGTWTTYVYANTARLYQVRRLAGGTVSTAADPVTTLYAAENRGYMGAAPADTGLSYAYIDGPRLDASDITYVWTNRWGAPTQVMDALGNRTWLFRQDPRFPEAVTSVDAPGGGSTPGQYDVRLVRYTYLNGRGDADSTKVLSPLGDGQSAITRYEYGDARWIDFVTRTTYPTGRTVSTGYDPSGNRLWQQAGADSARRVYFGFDALGRVSSVRSQRAVSAGEGAETMEYTAALGNLGAVVSPLGIRSTYLQDAIGRDTLVLSPVDSVRDPYGVVTGTLLYQRQTTRYDVMGRVLATVSVGPQMDFPTASYSTATPWGSIPAESVVVNNVYTGGLLTAVSRTAWPDSGGIGTVTSTYRYDALGRKVADVAPDGRADSTVYDPAGNVVQTVTRRGKVLTFAYDELNRLLHRSVPSEVVAADTKAVPGAAWLFPFFADSAGGTLNGLNRGSGSLSVPGEDAWFAYDGAGHMTRAVNADAVVARRYYPGGLLKTDTLKIRTYLGADTTAHVYGLRYAYDLEGRRTQLDVPANVAPWPGSAFGETYHYDAETGALDGVGYAGSGGTYDFTYGYDTEGRLTSFTRNGFQERHAYDADGRDTLRTEVKLATGWQMHRDRTRYDLRGKQLRVATPTDSVANGFSGLGTLARSYHDAFSSTASDQNESYTQDALGNQVTQRQSSLGGNQFQFDVATPISHRRYVPGTGRLRGSSTGTADGYLTGIDTTVYDDSGNRVWFYDSHGVSTPYPTYSGGVLVSGTSPATYVEWTRSWYGADEKLRFVDRRTCYVFGSGATAACDTLKEPMPSARAAFEEYRYDALGRRVLVRSRQHYACTTRCQSFLRRTVWDGDQVLVEIQAPGYTNTPAATMEQDVGFRVGAASSQVSDTSTAPLTNGSTYYPGYYFGRVLYTHGAGIDHPLAITRMEYSDSLPGPITVYPHANWKNSFDLGSYDGQTLNAPCKIVGYRNGTHTEFQPWVPGIGETTTPKDTLYNCLNIEWPAPSLWLTNRKRDNNMVGAEGWSGSLTDGMRDATGQMYMRNRYYDPSSARFTQEDPIGIAGGLNVYGFGGGDPVSYSDPYGLCPDGSTATSARGEGSTVVVTCSDGSEDVRKGGSIAWRNNNPGNLENGAFSRAHGSIGASGGSHNNRFAVFSDADAGFNATVARLETGAFRKLTLDEAIDRWAPATENNTGAYKADVHHATGVSGGTLLSILTRAQLESLARAIKRHEGWQEGTVTNRRPTQ